MIKAFAKDLALATIYALAFALGVAGFGAWLWGAW
jgi:hypothetical protein